MRAAGAITGLLVLGTFVIPGTYRVNEDFVSEPAASGASTRRASGPLDAGAAMLAGRVYDEGGRPLGGATVSLAGSGFWPARSLETGPDGRFRWPEVPAGVYELRVTKGRLVAPPIEGLILDAGARRSFGMRLAEGWTLRGRVVDAVSGRAVPGAEITVATGALGLHARRSRSDGAGAFDLVGVIGERQTLYAEADGYIIAGPLTQAAGDAPITVRLEREARIEGRVVDERGRPVRGASVRALGERTGTQVPATDTLGVTSGPVPPISAVGAQAPPAFIDQATTGPDGGFELDGLRPGTYWLAAAHEELAPATSETIRVGSGERRDGVRIVMRPGAELVGRVVDERGSGLEAIPIELRAKDERVPRMAVSGADGSFEFRGVRGEVTVTALPYDLPPSRTTVTIDDDSRVSVELALSTSLYTLRGRAVDERGFGIGGALLTVTSPDPRRPFRRSAKSDVDGTFSVPALPEPPYSLEAEHTAYSRTVLREIDGADEVEVVMSTGVTFLGEVLDDWTGEGLRGADVELEGPIQSTMKTRADGTFAFRQLPTGTYEVSLSHRDYETQVRRVVIEPPGYVDRPQELETVRLVPGGIVEGEVVDSNGDPVAGAKVTWDDPPRWDRAVRTDSGGAFRLPGIPGGTVWITAQHELAGENWTDKPVQVRPLETTPGVLIRLPDPAGE